MLVQLCLCLIASVLAMPTADASKAASALPHTGEATVRLGAGGLPCFTIAEHEEQRSGAPTFASIRVSEVAGNASSAAPAIVWSMAMPAGRGFPLMYSMCVPYGGRIKWLPQQSAELLDVGRLYEVVIGVRASDTGQARLLSARFCLVRQADGGNALRLPLAAGACATRAPAVRKRGLH